MTLLSVYITPKQLLNSSTAYLVKVISSTMESRDMSQNYPLLCNGSYPLPREGVTSRCIVMGC
jgi:hypothetical protein